MRVRPHLIIRSERRSIALSVALDATIVVRAPKNLPIEVISRFVASHSSWLGRKVKEVLARPVMRPRQFVDGEEILYLGRRFALQIFDGVRIQLKDKLFFPQNLLPSARAQLIIWYQRQARELIVGSVERWAAKLGFKYVEVKISGALHRWGSCSRAGNLNFSWRLMMAPSEMIDYVIVHELTHLVEKNHSKRFWARVRAALPDYKKRHQWLKDNDHLLKI